MKHRNRTIAAAIFGVGLSLGAAGLVSAAASTDSTTDVSIAAPVDTSTGDTSTGATTTGDSSTADTSTADPSTADPSTPAVDNDGDGDHGGHGGPHMANGITEEVLTGDTAASVQAAVLAAQPGATIERMETDAEGAVYEAHVTLADGSRATVKLDAAFTVTGTETGHG